MRMQLRQKLTDSRAHGEIRRQIASAIKLEFEGLMRLRGRLDGVRMARMHEFRIAFKRFRDVLEALKPLYAISEMELSALRQLQFALGEIQNLEVIEAGLQQWSRKQSRVVRSKLGPVYNEMRGARQAHTEIAFKCCEHIDTLWVMIQEEVS